MFRAVVLGLFITAILSGCSKRVETEERVIQKEESDYVISIVVDLSPSFWHLMQDEGKGHEFLMQIMSKYFRDRIGTNDKVVISVISGSKLALIWEGTPTQLRREFRSAEDFKQVCINRAFIDGKWGEGGSLVYESIAKTVEYLANDQSVLNGKCKSALFVLSDMDDTSNDPSSKERLLKALTVFGKAKGVVGIYYVAQDAVLSWRKELAELGLPTFIVESDIVSKPDLPSFE